MVYVCWQGVPNFAGRNTVGRPHVAFQGRQWWTDPCQLLYLWNVWGPLQGPEFLQQCYGNTCWKGQLCHVFASSKCCLCNYISGLNSQRRIQPAGTTWRNMQQAVHLCTNSSAVQKSADLKWIGHGHSLLESLTLFIILQVIAKLLETKWSRFGLKLFLIMQVRDHPSVCTNFVEKWACIRLLLCFWTLVAPKFAMSCYGAWMAPVCRRLERKHQLMEHSAKHLSLLMKILFFCTSVKQVSTKAVCHYTLHASWGFQNASSLSNSVLIFLLFCRRYSGLCWYYLWLGMLKTRPVVSMQVRVSWVCFAHLIDSLRKLQVGLFSQQLTHHKLDFFSSTNTFCKPSVPAKNDFTSHQNTWTSDLSSTVVCLLMILFLRYTSCVQKFKNQCFLIFLRHVHMHMQACGTSLVLFRFASPYCRWVAWERHSFFFSFRLYKRLSESLRIFGY